MGNLADELLHAEDHIRDRIALTLDPIQCGADRQFGGINSGPDHWTEWTKIIEALRASPLCKRRVPTDDVRRRDIVYASIAMDKGVGLLCGYAAAALAAGGWALARRDA